MSGYIFTLHGGCISWKATLQKVVSVSTIESEFIGATEGVKEALWLKGMISELQGKSRDVTVYEDNQSAIYLIKNPSFHERTKHIDVKLHFIRDVVAQGKVLVKKIDTEENPADALTKVLPCAKFGYFMELVQVIDPGGQSGYNP